MLFNQRFGSVEISFGSGIRGFVILSYGYGRKLLRIRIYLDNFVAVEKKYMSNRYRTEVNHYGIYYKIELVRKFLCI
jgi:hypothetical protein